MRHYQSIVRSGLSVTFPAFMAERVYMEEFTKQDGLPEHLSRWQNTVDTMLTGVDTDGPIYLMVDQAVPLIRDYVYAGNVSMLHESLPVAETCERTVVRLNVPGWTPQ